LALQIDEWPRADLYQTSARLVEVLHSLNIIRLFTQYFRNDFIGVEEWSRYRQDDSQCQPVCNAPRQRDHATFAAMWAQNLDEQGFPDALTRTLASSIAGA
jgi:hypothetical protein